MRPCTMVKLSGTWAIEVQDNLFLLPANSLQCLQPVNTAPNSSCGTCRGPLNGVPVQQRWRKDARALEREEEVCMHAHSMLKLAKLL